MGLPTEGSVRALLSRAQARLAGLLSHLDRLGLDAEEPHPAGKSADGAPKPVLRRRFILRRRAQRWRWRWRCLGVAVDLLRPRGERVQIGLHIPHHLPA